MARVMAQARKGLEIKWPDIPPIVSEKDKVAPTLEQWLKDPRSKQFSVDAT